MNPWKEQGVQLWENLPRIHEDEPWHAQIVITLRKSAPYARGCISQIANPIIPQDDVPHIHGDAFAALAGNQRILASDKANCQIETLWRTGRFYFCLSFF